MTKTETELKKAILQLEIKPNTLVFVDRVAINIRELAHVMESIRFAVEGSFFIPIHVAPGKTIAESLAVATDEQKREWAELTARLRPPFETFTGPTCKGCLALGNACGFCEKCVWEKAELAKS